ncbi:MAG: hypothetical protein M3O34_07360 [Chloroflexota bacterium]|nr:hypothetical protein [Chloroflexota bacterium]
MNPFAELPTWAAVLVALFAGGVLVALNIGWLMAAKSMLDAQRRKNQERRAGAAPPPARPDAPATAEREGADRSGRTPIL